MASCVRFSARVLPPASAEEAALWLPLGQANALVTAPLAPECHAACMSSFRTFFRIRHFRGIGGRALGVFVLCAALAALLSVDALFAPMQRLLDAARPLITAHPGWGGVLFVLLSALSAMLAFFSSAVLVPVAVYSWGRLATTALLWLGWLLGGIAAYGVGRFVAQPLVRTLASRRLVDFYLRRLPARVTLPIAMLIQTALPSELPGYLFGTMRVRFRTYLIALAVIELPFAVGTVLLGESIVQRESAWLLVLVAIGLTATLCAAYLLHKRLRMAGRLADTAASQDQDKDAARTDQARASQR